MSDQPPGRSNAELTFEQQYELRKDPFWDADF